MNTGKPCSRSAANKETDPECPVCGGRVIQRKSIATCATIRSTPYCESEWKCMQCKMNFSAKMIGGYVLSREADYEKSLETGIHILGNAASGRGDDL